MEKFDNGIFRGYWLNEEGGCGDFSVTIPLPKAMVEVLPVRIENSGKVFERVEANCRHTVRGETQIIFRIFKDVIGWVSVNEKDEFVGWFDTEPKRDEGVYIACLVQKGAQDGLFRTDRFAGKWQSTDGQSGPFTIDLRRRILPESTSACVSLTNCQRDTRVDATFKYRDGVQCRFEFNQVKVSLQIGPCGRFRGNFVSPHDAGTYTAKLDTGASTGEVVGWWGRAMPQRTPDGENGKAALFLCIGSDNWREYVEWGAYDFVVQEQRDGELVLFDGTSDRGGVHVRLTRTFAYVRARFTGHKYQKYYYGTFTRADADLPSCQLKAVDCTLRQNQEDTDRSILRNRLHNMLGNDFGNLHELENWIADRAPIMIHAKLDKLISGGLTIVDAYLQDTEYRTIFETHTGGGCTDLGVRRGWERRMWGDAYDGKDSQRPKYGCLNLADDPDGDYQATWYGPSYFVLKNSLRWRCTITNCDSSNQRAVQGSLRQCSKMLMALDDGELRAAASHVGDPGSGHAFATYKEVQIHGPVRFDHDIERLVADAGLSVSARDKVTRFAAKHGIQLEWRKMGQRFTRRPDQDLVAP